MAATHPMFQAFPLTAHVDLSTGQAPTPYHVYGGDGVTIYGRINAQAAAPLFAAEDVYPVHYDDGSIAAGFIFADFRDASMGPHCELQFFILSSFKKGQTIDNRAMSLPLAMALQPEWGTLCVKLWNNDRAVIAYNNDYLGLNAAYAAFDLSIKDDSVAFNVMDEAQADILSVEIRDLKSTALSNAWEMVRIAGVWQMLKLGRQPYFQGSVINRKSAVMPENRQAPIFTSSDRSISKHWNRDIDQLAVGNDDIRRLAFQPRAVQHIKPFRFIYLHPDQA